MTARGGTPPKHAPGAARTPFALLVLGLIGGGMVALLALNTASAANEVRRHDVAGQDQGVAASLVQLQNEAQASAAPANLAAAAAALGMVPAGNPAFLQIDKGGRVTMLGSAAPASAIPVYVAPKPSPTPKPTKSRAKPKSSASASTSASKSASKSASSSSSPRTRTTTTTKKKIKTPAKPTPTPSPTPTLTLPGGNR